MADDDSALMREFEEFLKAKQEKEKADQDAEDFDVEIWDKDGRGVRTKRSHAKPFLQTLGIDIDPPADDKDKDKDGDKDKKPKPRPPAPQSITAKYFTKKPS